MNKARVRTNVADLRKEPRPDSRRSSQLLFNEAVEVIEENQDWRLVKGTDGYPGWIREVYLGDFRLDGEKDTVKSLQAPVFNQNGHLLTRLTFGTKVSGRPEGQYFQIDFPGEIRAKTELSNLVLNSSGPRCENFSDLALRFIGIPYLWGGSSSFGFDCSGLVQRLYGYHGVDLPRDSDQQIDQGSRVELGELDESEKVLEIGDLIFFEGHVGIYLEGGKMIHSSRRHNGVAISDLTSIASYVEHLREIFVGARRILEFNEKVS